MEKPSVESVRKVKEKYKKYLMPMPGVNGVGIGNGCLRVYTVDKDTEAELKNLLAKEVDEVAVSVVCVGQIVKREN